MLCDEKEQGYISTFEGKTLGVSINVHGYQMRINSFTHANCSISHRNNDKANNNASVPFRILPQSAYNFLRFLKVHRHRDPSGHQMLITLSSNYSFFHPQGSALAGLSQALGTFGTFGLLASGFE
jgi:hypothetical protein